MSINWRASLVPAAAVIPAPIAYIKVVAVKKPVVEFVSSSADPSSGVIQCVVGVYLGLILIRAKSVTLRKLECFKQACCLEYSSME
jgi:hypothetical protein